jgi:hypothetical protein
MRYFAKHLCMLPSLLAFGLVGRGAVAAECLTSSGVTACGYHCVADYGQVRCAQTPQGACSLASDVVACWDPPPVVRVVFGSRRMGPPRIDCVNTYGQTACGYDCIVSDDRVQCAQTPFGACLADQGNLVCWDPPAAVMLSRGILTPHAECIHNSGRVVCGYHCAAHHGDLRCAETPEGACTVRQDKLVCWDPPLDSFANPFDAATELACLDAVSGRTCGYHCIATAYYSACGVLRNESCRAEPGGIVCKSSQ